MRETFRKSYEVRGGRTAESRRTTRSTRAVAGGEPSPLPIFSDVCSHHAHVENHRRRVHGERLSPSESLLTTMTSRSSRLHVAHSHEFEPRNPLEHHVYVQKLY